MSHAADPGFGTRRVFEYSGANVVENSESHGMGQKTLRL